MTDDPDKAAKRAQIKAAKQLANQTMRHAAGAEWQARRDFMRASRGGDLVLPDVMPETRTQAIYNHALERLNDIGQHDPDTRLAIQALTVVLQHQLKMAEIHAGMTAKLTSAVQAQVMDELPVPRMDIAEADVSKVHEALVLHRKLVSKGAA